MVNKATPDYESDRSGRGILEICGKNNGKNFLSSTYEDLIDHRRATREALERFDQQVVRMENFGARPMEPTEACLNEIANCDLFVGIYAHRYGYIPDRSSESITEREFRHARALNKPVFYFVVDPKHLWPPEMFENEPGRTKLIALKNEIQSSFVIDTFTTPDNLAYKIVTSVGRYLNLTSHLSLSPTQILIMNGSYFGRLDSNSGKFAILLRVKFRKKKDPAHPS